MPNAQATRSTRRLDCLRSWPFGVRINAWLGLYAARGLCHAQLGSLFDFIPLTLPWPAHFVECQQSQGTAQCQQVRINTSHLSADLPDLSVTALRNCQHGQIDACTDLARISLLPIHSSQPHLSQSTWIDDMTRQKNSWVVVSRLILPCRLAVLEPIPVHSLDRKVPK